MTVGPVREERSYRLGPDLTAGPPRPATRALLHDRFVDRAFDRLDRAFAAEAAQFAKLAADVPKDDGILYLGLNPESEAIERRALDTYGPVRALTGDAFAEVVIAGKHYDLAKPEDLDAFVTSLRLDPRVESAVREVFRNAAPEVRGKLAQLANVFAEAEAGKAIPSRLVLSGHSGGTELWGGRGMLRLDDVLRLARAMPRAAAQIEDIHLAACSTSGQAGVDDVRAGWQAAFPALKTMWGYAGSSPLAPAAHLAAWARATKGSHERLDVPTHLAKQHITTWSVKGGLSDGVQLADLRRAQVGADSRFAKFVAGEITAGHQGMLADPQTALHDYETYRVLSQRNDVPREERAAFAQKADQLLRIRYYEEGVRTAFANRYGAGVIAAFGAGGLPAPDFAKLSRADALQEIAALEKQLSEVARMSPDAERGLAALRGLRDLSPDVVRTTDCRH